MKFPPYLKICIVLLNIILVFGLLYLGGPVIVPFIFALFIAIVLNPIVRFLTEHKVPRIISIFLSLILAFILIGGLASFLFLQVSMFSKSYPVFSEKFNQMINETINMAAAKFNIDAQKMMHAVDNAESESFNSLTHNMGHTLLSIGTAAVAIVIIPVYVFLIIYYETLLLEFIRKLFDASYHQTVVKVLESVKEIIQGYLRGLLIEGAIVAALNSIALLALGIEYAVLLGITGAILNVIPFIGGIAAIALPMVVALVTKSWVSALLVMVLYLVIQFIDNHYLIPYIVASKVKINALVAIIVVLLGDMLWGVPGMFLSIPLVALVKVVFDNIESLKPWGFVLGDNIPSVIRLPFMKHRHKAA